MISEERLLSMADYVTEMNKIKHPYDKGTPARKEIEFWVPWPMTKLADFAIFKKLARSDKTKPKIVDILNTENLTLGVPPHWKFSVRGIRESGESPEHLTVAVIAGEFSSRREPAIGESWEGRGKFEEESCFFSKCISRKTDLAVESLFEKEGLFSDWKNRPATKLGWFCGGLFFILN